jgi:hypothetical protein
VQKPSNSEEYKPLDRYVLMVGSMKSYNRKVFIVKGPNDCLEAFAIYTPTTLTLHSTTIYFSVSSLLRFFLVCVFSVRSSNVSFVIPRFFV